MSRAIGPDISFYQDDNTTARGVDFDKMKAAPSDFVNIRVGQNTWIDSDFKENWAAAKAAGIPRGSYWFYDSRSTPQSQAKRWADALGVDAGELPLFADYEENYGGPYGSAAHFHTFLKELEFLLPEKEITIYTGYYFWEDRVLPKDRYLFADYGLWIARYSDSEPWIPEPWEYDKWDFWQHTSHGPGPYYGAESLNIDLNYYNGTPEEFKLRFGLGEVEPPDPPTPPVEETLYRLAEVDGSFCFIPVEGEPAPPEPYEMQLVKKEGKSFAVIHRTPDDGEVHKIQLDFIEGATIKTLDIPKNRIMMKDDGTTHEVPNWETEADFHNLNAVWAFLPIQEVQKSNLNFRMLHTAWTESGSKGNWDTMGSYIKRDYLKAIGAPPVEPVEEYPMDAFLRKFYIPDSGDFKRIGHDFESAYWNYEPRSSKVNLDNNDSPPTHALPDTAKPKFDKFNELSPEWQWFIRDLNWHFAPHYTEAEINEIIGKEVFADTVFGFDNHAAQNGYENVITGENNGSSKGYIQMKELGAGGCPLEVLEDNGREIVARAYNPKLPPPTVEEALKSGLVMSACQSTCYKNANEDWDKIHNAKPMPYLRMADGKTKIGYMYPFIAENGRAIFYKKQPPSKEGGSKSNELYDIENGAEYSPYIKR